MPDSVSDPPSPAEVGVTLPPSPDPGPGGAGHPYATHSTGGGIDQSATPPGPPRP